MIYRLSILLSLLLLLPLSATAQPSVPPEDMYQMTNAARLANGVGLLAWSDTLAQAAQQHAEDIAQREDPGHVGSDGSTVQERASRAGYEAYPDRVRVSENWSTGTALQAMAFFLEDQVHRDNLLQPAWREVGIGRADWVRGGEIWVVVFGARPGVLPVFINQGAQLTNEREVTVQLSQEEAGWNEGGFTTPVEIRAGEIETIAGAAWQPWQPEIELELSPEGGEKRVIVEYRDAQGNVVQSSDTIFLLVPEGPVPTARVQLAPTLTPTPTPTITPTPTPTPTPTITPTPTTTPTPTATPTPTLFLLPLEGGGRGALLLIGLGFTLLAGIFIAALVIARSLGRGR